MEMMSKLQFSLPFNHEFPLCMFETMIHIKDILQENCMKKFGDIFILMIGNIKLLISGKNQYIKSSLKCEETGKGGNQAYMEFIMGCINCKIGKGNKI